MEELKSCLFCGKGVDRDYAYCPWCGYEFGPGDDAVCDRDESLPGAAAPDDTIENRCESLAAALFGVVRETPRPAAQEPAPAPRPPTDLPSVLQRLRSLEQLLSEMEEELDGMLRTASGGP